MNTNNESQEATNSYLTFRLGEEEYGVQVQNVLNILEHTQITKVPKAPDYMTGVINLRGSVLPVIDARLKLGMEATSITDNTCIVVMDLNMQGEKVYTGILVDKVEAVHEIQTSEIKDPTDQGNIYNVEFMKGLVEMNEDFIIILDAEKIIGFQDMQAIMKHTPEKVSTI